MDLELDDFTAAYLECALWSSHAWGEDGEDLGNLDDEYGIYDFAPEALAQAVKECRDFRDLCLKEIGPDCFAEWSDEQAGHDFWLTRNGHGAGFWDRGLKHGDELSKWAKSFGSCDLMAYDGKVYSS